MIAEQDPILNRRRKADVVVVWGGNIDDRRPTMVQRAVVANYYVLKGR